MSIVHTSIKNKITVCKRQMIRWIKTLLPDELGGNGHLTRTMIVYKQETIIGIHTVIPAIPATT